MRGVAVSGWTPDHPTRNTTLNSPTTSPAGPSLVTASEVPAGA